MIALDRMKKTTVTRRYASQHDEELSGAFLLLAREKVISA